MKDIAEGMFFLHGKGLAHRDLKTDNILLDAYGDHLMTTKLCDFGTAHQLDHTTEQAITGTYLWMAPEVIKNAPINQKGYVFFIQYGPL